MLDQRVLEAKPLRKVLSMQTCVDDEDDPTTPQDMPLDVPGATLGIPWDAFGVLRMTRGWLLSPGFALGCLWVALYDEGVVA